MGNLLEWELWDWAVELLNINKQWISDHPNYRNTVPSHVTITSLLLCFFGSWGVWSFCTLICDDTISHSLSSELYYWNLHIRRAQFVCWFFHITGSAVQHETIRFILPLSTICVEAISLKNVFHSSLMYGDIMKLKHFFIKNSPSSPLKKKSKQWCK